MRRIKTIVFFAAALLLFTAGRDVCRAQMPEEKVIAFPDGKIFDFGDITISDGPQKCSFTFRNISSKPVQILNVISSCGCTTPEWTQAAVEPGKSGTIGVTFSNDQGPSPFDKTLTVYVSNVNRPVLLHIRGVVHEKNKPLADRFPCHIGKLGFRNLSESLKYIDQGKSRSDRATVANLGSSPASVKAVGLASGLSISVSPNPIPPKSTATLTYSVDTKKMDAVKWGKEKFICRFAIDGKAYPDLFCVEAFIKEDFSNVDDAAMKSAPVAEAEKSYFEFGTIKPGAKVTAVFTIRNTGKRELIIRKIESDSKNAVPLTKCPLTVKSGGSTTIKASVDTRGMKGESLSILTLITNSPKKPIMNLFITGIII